MLLGAKVTPIYADQPLSVEQVFQVTTKQLDSKTISVHWTIKPGYYLYREKIHFKSDQPIKSAFLPPGISKHSKFLNKYHIYQSGITVLLKFLNPLPAKLQLNIYYQGCAAAGFCYPPVNRQFNLLLQQKTGSGHVLVQSAQNKAMALLAGHNIGLILLGFFGFGLLLSLTPCVLPLIPILYAIILGHKRQLTTLNAFSLSLVYVLAMALTYALAGVFAGLAGSYLQSFLQSPLVIIFVSLVFIFLAFSLFGFYDLKVPARWQEKINNLTNRQQGGSYWGVALMGCLSTLVVSPCITAPLVGVLTYIANTGDALLGGVALFILGLGSAVPLLIMGTSAGKWLPKSGSWMIAAKIGLGIIMLIMAGWLLLRIIPQNSQVYNFFGSNHVAYHSGFQTIKGIPDFERALIKAKKENKLVLLDFFAQWCMSCKEMEQTVFPAHPVKSLLSRFIVLRADVSANDCIDKALERKFHVIAPPTFLFFTPDGIELNGQRIVGQLSQRAFAKHLQQVLVSQQRSTTNF